MRNKHVFSEVKTVRCAFCGKEFERTVTVEYVTNEKGDVIGHEIAL